MRKTRPYLANIRISKHSQDKSSFVNFYASICWSLKMLGQIGLTASQERIDYHFTKVTTWEYRNTFSVKNQALNINYVTRVGGKKQKVFLRGLWVFTKCLAFSLSPASSLLGNSDRQKYCNNSAPEEVSKKKYKVKSKQESFACVPLFSFLICMIEIFWQK